MFKKKISKPKSTILSEIQPLLDDSEDIQVSPLKKPTGKPICKGLQYCQNQSQQGLILNKPIPTVAKDPVVGFIEKEWAKQTNIGKNDKILDKFMEERLKEFHDKINKVEIPRENEISCTEVVELYKEPELGEANEMEKLKEVFIYITVFMYI